ncbi:MAG: hypothetical protein ACJAYX_002858 [Planctomycetota bacterium]|jgi:uncharacterized protein YbcC (UPF0753/DUF2309 family)
MTTLISNELRFQQPDVALNEDIEQACKRIAPTWPLDRMIAVNPYWGHLDQRIEAAAAQLAASSGAKLSMPRAWYREHWQAGRLRRNHLEAALDMAGNKLTVNELVAAMQHDEATTEVAPLVTNLADTVRVRTEPQPWSELCVHQISQHTAAWFDDTQAAWGLARTEGLYGSWRKALAADRGLPTRKGYSHRQNRVNALPDTASDCIGFVVERLGLDAEQRRTWLAVLLGSVRGWAAWCAYERWQARLLDGDDDQIVQLLAMRAAWEWLLVEDLSLQTSLSDWRDRLDQHPNEVARLQELQSIDWLLQHALEIAFQQPLQAGLRPAAVPREPTTTAAVQAVFCIDVRSERFRRAIETASDDAVRTRGFAGFFGLPVAYAPFGTDATRPQLPGLLAPSRVMTQAVSSALDGETLRRQRQDRLGWQQRWRRFRSAAASAFTFVESCGLFYGWKLLRQSLATTHRPERADDAGLQAGDAACLRPTWGEGAGAPSPNERIDLAAGVLGAMGLTRDFARLVLLAGHGSTSTNNPHAAGLDCGACGGQTGEVNARLLTALLADEVVRTGLAMQGIEIPTDTHFVAGLHDTTTDELQLFDIEMVPATHAEDLQQLREWLSAAGERTRAERAPSLGLGELQHDAQALSSALHRRAADWAQVRPEWGLADNAAFVVAPRARTRHLDLGGRVFLHDYDWASDEGFATLTLIMTAPMVVTNWINLQYYASTVDNQHFGSGNKVLHNVVGGNLGVFEGNGGDLRIGLSMQSLHDGEQWRHTPLRLSVYLAAPAEAIDDVLAAHKHVRLLVENGWLHLFRLNNQGDVFQRLPVGGEWRRADPSASV